jgi:hypothetical protein
VLETEVDEVVDATEFLDSAVCPEHAPSVNTQIPTNATRPTSKT